MNISSDSAIHLLGTYLVDIMQWWMYDNIPSWQHCLWEKNMTTQMLIRKRLVKYMMVYLQNK